MKARTPGMRTKRLATWTLTIGLCLTMAGCVKAKGDRPVQPPEPPPTASAQADTTPTPTEEPSAADLWSDDRSRIDTPLLATVGLNAVGNLRGGLWAGPGRILRPDGHSEA